MADTAIPSTGKHRLLIKNLAQLVCVCRRKEPFLLGPIDDLAIVEDGAVAVDGNGRILAVGNTATVLAAVGSEEGFDLVVDGTGRSLVPGLCDGHTHPVWVGDRVHEFALKLKGATYMDIHKAGGGIGFTVGHTKAATEDELLAGFLGRLDRMAAFGTTLVEAKSGYGLETETELKMLRVITRAKAAHAIDIVSTFCGAHSVPKGRSVAEATEDVICKQLPAVVAARDAGTIAVDNIDVFCDKGIFERPEAERILRAGQAAGLQINFHGDELNYVGAAELGGELQALAISHLEEISDSGIMAMAMRPTFAVLLPSTAYVLRITPPPARRLIEASVPVALGSDFNPNAHCLSMPHIMNLACVLMRLSMPEALAAATINAAGSMGRAQDHGSIEVGKFGNFVLIGHARWEHLVYEIADPPIDAVYVQGRPLDRKRRS